MTNKPALFIGRFQPFHLGHLDAVRQILRRHKKVIIGIGSAQYERLPKNPFSARERKKMIEQTLRAARISKKKNSIVLISDIHDDGRWVAHVERLAPTFGEVWSGTPKVRRLFRSHGKHPVMAPKMNLKISGTEIRKRMKRGERWRHLVPKSIKNLKI